MEHLNRLHRFDIEVEGGKAFLVGNPDGKYVRFDSAETAFMIVDQQRDQLAEALRGLLTDFAHTLPECESVQKARAALESIK